MFERYAIYVTPKGALAETGAAWLGWDVASGQAVAHPDVSGVAAADLTETPRKYGFHGTIKPPFVLADGKNPDQLMEATETLCTTLAPVRLDGLELVALGRFLALIPIGDQRALATLAGTVVQKLDDFRAPPSEAELARRRQSQLTSAQESHLVRWGYPYVLDQFRFHLTLTSKLPKAQVADAHAAVEPLFADHMGPLMIDDLTLVGQRADGMFEEIQRYPLTGKPLE